MKNRYRPSNAVYEKQVENGNMTHEDVIVDALKRGFRLYWNKNRKLQEAPSGTSVFFMQMSGFLLDNNMGDVDVIENI